MWIKRRVFVFEPLPKKKEELKRKKNNKYIYRVSILSGTPLEDSFHVNLKLCSDRKKVFLNNKFTVIFNGLLTKKTFLNDLTKTSDNHCICLSMHIGMVSLKIFGPAFC